MAVSMMELPSKKLFSIPLPSEEGGDMITMKQFMQIIKKEMSKHVYYLMVGDRRISCTDYLRSVHYFLLDNSPWYVHTAEPSATTVKKMVFIITCTETMNLNLDECETVFDVKRMITWRTSIPASKQILMTMVGHQLMDYESTESIHSGEHLNLQLCLRGGTTQGLPFANVTDEARPALIEWAKTAPGWRIARPGMSLEGKCTNRRCKAYGKMVVMNKKFAEFDFINEAHTCKCPICEKGVQPTTCGFNNCQWKFVSRKVVPGQRPKMFWSEWESVGDKYARFSPERNGTAHFLDLKILCKEEQRRVCAVCAKQITSWSKKAKCGHIFHNDCYDFATSTDRNCIECTAEDSMTRYQKIFGG